MPSADKPGWRWRWSSRGHVLITHELGHSLYARTNNVTPGNFASAMAGGGDYGVFADGRYQTTEQLYRLNDYLKLHESLESKVPKK